MTKSARCLLTSGDKIPTCYHDAYHHIMYIIPQTYQPEKLNNLLSKQQYDCRQNILSKSARSKLAYTHQQNKSDFWILMKDIA